jgi:hypothetical protein
MLIERENEKREKVQKLNKWWRCGLYPCRVVNLVYEMVEHM